MCRNRLIPSAILAHTHDDSKIFTQFSCALCEWFRMWKRDDSSEIQKFRICWMFCDNEWCRMHECQLINLALEKWPTRSPIEPLKRWEEKRNETKRERKKMSVDSIVWARQLYMYREWSSYYRSEHCLLSVWVLNVRIPITCQTSETTKWSGLLFCSYNERKTICLSCSFPNATELSSSQRRSSSNKIWNWNDQSLFFFSPFFKGIHDVRACVMYMCVCVSACMSLCVAFSYIFLSCVYIVCLLVWLRCVYLNFSIRNISMCLFGENEIIKYSLSYAHIQAFN